MNSVEDYALGLEGEQKAIVQFLHHRITEHHGLMVQLKFDIPMYSRKSWICYMNPIKKGGIELAFVNGHLLSNEQGILSMKKRKYVAGIDLFHISEIPEKAIDEIIQEAIILDDLGKKPFSK